MVHIKGQWGTSINVFDDEHEVEISIVEPHAPTRPIRISHQDAERLRDALDAILKGRASR